MLFFLLSVLFLYYSYSSIVPLFVKFQWSLTNSHCDGVFEFPDFENTFMLISH